MIDDSFIVEIWDIFKEYVPEKNRETAATQFVEFLQDAGVKDSVLESVLGYDQYLDSAIELIINEDEYNEEDDDPYDDDVDEDEDY